jgi:hypothetical protein
MTAGFRMMLQVACYARSNFHGMMMSMLHLSMPVASTHISFVQWLKKLSQCLVTLQRLMHTSTMTWSSILKILGIIVSKKGFNLNLGSHDLDKN